MKQRSLRRALNAFGFDEAINFSFIQQEDTFRSDPVRSRVTRMHQPQLANPIIEDAAWMRSTLLARLAELRCGTISITAFATSVCLKLAGFSRVSAPGELPQETLALAMVATGGALEENRAQAERELDFFDLKGALEAAVDWMNLSPLSFAPASVRHLRAGQTARINSG